MSALPDWKSHGATNTKSLSLIHILLLILPRIRHVLTLPSMHFTIILSPPTSLMTRPNSSPCWGNTNSLRWDSLNTFLLPISKTYRNRICNINLKDYGTIILNLLFGLNSFKDQGQTISNRVKSDIVCAISQPIRNSSIKQFFE